MSEDAIRVYDQDGLRSLHNHDFMKDPDFQSAYARGVKAVGQDYHWHWRVHVGLWAARAALSVPGDFVECGTNRGFLASAIMQQNRWNEIERMFYLMDTFSGLDTRYVSVAEINNGALDRNKLHLENGFYTTNVEGVVENFSEWTNVRIIQGSIPETLPQIDAQQVAFVHIDLNCAPPEVAAMDYLWSRLTPGGLVLLDDYAFFGYLPQKTAMDEFARRKGVRVLSLPTGQGLILVPGFS